LLWRQKALDEGEQFFRGAFGERRDNKAFGGWGRGGMLPRHGIVRRRCDGEESPGERRRTPATKARQKHDNLEGRRKRENASRIVASVPPGRHVRQRAGFPG